MAACPHAGALPCQHVVVFNVALSGHVIPTLPIVAQLVTAGHKVTYYTSDTEHQAAVETVGAVHRVVTPLAQANADADGKRGSMLDLIVTGLNALPWILDSVRSLTPTPSVIFNDVLAVWGQ